MKILILFILSFCLCQAEPEVKRVEMQKVIKLDKTKDDKFRVRVKLVKMGFHEANAFLNPPLTPEQIAAKKLAKKQAEELRIKERDEKRAAREKEAKKRGVNLTEDDPLDPGVPTSNGDYTPPAPPVAAHVYTTTYKNVVYHIVSDKAWVVGRGTNAVMSWTVGVDGKPVLFLYEVRK